MSIFGASFTWVLLTGTRTPSSVRSAFRIGTKDSLVPNRPGADGDPLRLAGLVVEVDLGGGTDLLAGLVVHVLADHAADGVGADHR